MIRIAASALMASIACAQPPAVKEKAVFARWMVKTMEWGVLASTSTRSEASTVGDPFGNPQSMADANGVPYFFVSMLDATMMDVFSAAGGGNRVSLALTEAMLKGDDVVAACTVATGDPENPPCGRLQVTGLFVAVDPTAVEHDAAMAVLLEKHPSFAFLPENHGFFIGKLEVESLWLINEFGGAAIISADEYFAVDHSNLLLQSRTRPVGAVPFGAADPRPDTADKIGTARWMAHTLIWGVVSTRSTRSEGTVVGAPFANPNSFADGVNGALYFFVSDLDASMIDVKFNSRMTFALSEAELEGTSDAVSACIIGSGLADPESPPCARLVFSGDFFKVDNATDEYDTAKAVLFHKHPSFAYLPADHNFFVGKMRLDGIWLISEFGGAANISPEEYYAYSAESILV